MVVLGALLVPLGLIIAVWPWWAAGWPSALRWSNLVLHIVAALLVGLLTMIIVLWSVSSWDNEIRRHFAGAVEGATLPKITIIGSDPSHPTYLIFPGIYPRALITFTRRDNGTVDPTSSVYGLSKRANLAFFDFPERGLDEHTAFPYAIHRLREAGLRDLRLLTDSMGSGVGEHFRHWYESPNGGAESLGPLHGYLILFPYPSASYIRDPAARIGSFLQAAVCSGGGLSDAIWVPLSSIVARASSEDAHRAAAEGYEEAFKRSWHGIHHYRGACANNSYIARATAFEDQPERPQYPIIIMSVPAGRDPLLDTARIRALLERKFPGVPTDRFWYDLPGAHGQVLDFGREFADRFNAAENIFATSERRAG
jgi:hypothetical protein